MSISYKLSFIIMGLVVVTALAVGMTIDRGSRGLIENLEIHKLDRVVDLHAAHLDDALQRLRADLDILQRTPLLTRTVATTDAEFEAAWSDPSHRARVSDLFEIFHARQEDYTQVRVIRADEAGSELVRVDRLGEQLVRIATADLQDKGDRFYIEHGRTLSAGDIWLSPINLNRERSAITPERQPVIRGVAPVCDSDGRVRLLVVINRRIDGVFDQISHANTDNQVTFVTNQFGDYLIHPEREKTFGFEFGRRFTLQADWPELDGLFAPGASAPTTDQTFEQGGDVLAFGRVALDDTAAERYLVVAIVASKDQVLAGFNAIRYRSLGISLLLLFVAGAASVLLARRITRPVREITRGVARFATDRDVPELPRQDGHDELAVLSRQTQRMMEQVVMRERDLRATTLQLQNAADIAAKAALAKGNFLANMSHEIRTPLTAILGYSEVLQDPHATHNERADAVISISRSGEHLLQLINNVLDVSKLESDSVMLELRPCCPVELVCQIESIMRASAESKGLAFAIEYESAVPRFIRTDAGRLRQVLVNLLGNAIKFTDVGRVALAVKYEPASGDTDQSEADGGRIRFTVHDTGPGIDSETRGRLFQAFVQADTSIARRFGGTGLGLTICRKLAELMGSRIEIDSTPGMGSSFRFEIAIGVPAAEVELLEPCHAQDDQGDQAGQSESDPTAEAGSAQDPAAPAETAFQGQRILLADDSPDNQRLFAFLLKKMGLDATVVCDGSQAIDAVCAADKAGEPFQMVLMDVSMPVIDGLAATRALRDQGYTLPIVALTANAMEGDEKRCLAAGCDAYATKPIPREQLKQTVAKWVVPDTAEQPSQHAA